MKKPRHATFNAIAYLSRHQTPDDTPRYIAACDWTQELYALGCFGALEATRLMNELPTTLPDCPTCAMFVDIGLEYGIAVNQAALDRMEREEKEKKKKNEP